MGKTIDLVVSSGERIVISSRVKKFGAFVKKINVASLEELKQTIGLPDEIANDLPIGEGMLTKQNKHEIESRMQHPNAFLKMLTRAYLFDHSSKFQTANKAWEEFVKRINISMFLVNDLTVETGGILVIDRDVDILHANNILIKKGGLITINGSGLTIKCKSITGENNAPDLPVRPPFLDIRFTKACQNVKGGICNG